VPWPYWPPQKHFGKTVSGQVVLSKHPIESQRIIEFSPPQNLMFFQKPFYLKRKCQELNLKINNDNFYIYNLHLEAFDAACRKQEIENISLLIEDRQKKLPESKFIVCGDFNTNHSQLQILSKNNSLATANQENKNTFPSWEPSEELDHIFTSNNLNINNFGTLNCDNSSDHLALIAEFSIEKM
jgi:endonuclease/exonuclease/phosphatase family metal-dependent hydrolase